MSLFIASGNAPELFEPIDEALSTVTFLVNLAIEPAPSVVLGSYRGGYRKYVLTHHIALQSYFLSPQIPSEANVERGDPCVSS